MKIKKPATNTEEDVIVQAPALDALKDLAIQSNVIADKLKNLVLSENRHGDLQVIRSAALHVVRSADILIAEEQR